MKKIAPIHIIKILKTVKEVSINNIEKAALLSKFEQ